MFGLAGCGSDQNSPEMGAVPPKPDPNVVSKMPESVRQQMSAAPSAQTQAAEMGQMAKNLKSKTP